METNLSRGEDVLCCCGIIREVDGRQHLTGETLGTDDWLSDTYRGVS